MSRRTPYDFSVRPAASRSATRAMWWIHLSPRVGCRKRYSTESCSQLPVVQLLAQVQHARAVVRVQVLDPELHGPEALLPLRREGRRGRETGRRRRRCAGRSPPRSRRGRRGRRPPPGGPRSSQQLQLVAPPGERVGEDLRDELQPVHDRVRPVALRLQGVEAQRRRRASSPPTSERERQVRLDAEKAAALPVDGGLRRQVLERGDDDPSAGQHLLRRTRGTDPGAAAREARGPAGRGSSAWA